MSPPKKRLGEILIDSGLIDEFQVNTALNEQKRWGGKLGEHLIRLGYISEEAMLDALRNQLKIPTVNLKKVKIPEEIIKMLPEELIRKHKALPVGSKNIGGKDHLIVAMSDPTNLPLIDELQFSTKLKIMPALAGPLTLDKALKYYLDGDQELFEEAIEQDAFSPQHIRDRMEITEGTRTVTGASLGDKEKPQAPLPTEGFAEEIQQLRAEVTVLRNLLIQEGHIDRKKFVEEVVREKNKN